MNDDPGGLVNRHQVMIFEKNVEGGGVSFDGSPLRECCVRNVDRQHVAGRDSRRDPANGSAIDADGSSIDPRLNPGAGGCLEIRQMPAESGSVSGATVPTVVISAGPARLEDRGVSVW